MYCCKYLLKNEVIGIDRKGDRIISLKIVVAKESINVINVYACQVRLDDQIQIFERPKYGSMKHSDKRNDLSN